MTNLAKAICAVMNDVPYVQKQRAGDLKYSFAGESAIIEALHPAMVSHGLALIPDGVTLIDNSTFTTKNGAVMRHVLAACKYTLMHTSGESKAVETLGEANDTGDKAANKAMTAAYKYALRQTFCIETGDDPDKYGSDDQEQAQPQKPIYDPKEILSQFRNDINAAKCKDDLHRAGAKITAEIKEAIPPEYVQMMHGMYKEAASRLAQRN